MRFLSSANVFKERKRFKGVVEKYWCGCGWVFLKQQNRQVLDWIIVEKVPKRQEKRELSTGGRKDLQPSLQLWDWQGVLWAAWCCALHGALVHCTARQPVACCSLAGSEQQASTTVPHGAEETLQKVRGWKQQSNRQYRWYMKNHIEAIHAAPIYGPGRPHTWMEYI